jgi:hypothetical protein
MEKNKESGFVDKAKMYVERHTPGKSRHSLTGASYNLEDVSPFAVDLSGAPKNKGLMVILATIGFYLVTWFWYGWVHEGIIDYMLLEKMSFVAFYAGIALVIMLIGTLIDFHKGSFTPYSKIIEMRVRSLLGKPLKRVEFKVIKYWELYNPVYGGYWRSAKDYRAEADKEEAEGKSEESEGEKKKKPKQITDFVPVNTDLHELEGKRFSSMRDMQEIMKMALIEGEVVETKDEIKGILDLKREFADLSEKIQLPFVVTMCECDSKGGKVYPIFISNYSLFGGSTGLDESYVEFRDHTLAQRTWAGIMSKDNVRAGVGEGVELGKYMFYELVSEELQLSGKGEETMKFAPIVFRTTGPYRWGCCLR